MHITRYVLGFMFNLDLTKVVLLRKTHPIWQAGKLNGTGGHIEPGETALAAMVREHLQETGVQTDEGHWHHFARMGDGHEFEVEMFAMRGDVFSVANTTEESVHVYEVNMIAWGGCIENLHWIIALAVDHMRDGRPAFATITYPYPPRQ